VLKGSWGTAERPRGRVGGRKEKADTKYRNRFGLGKGRGEKRASFRGMQRWQAEKVQGNALVKAGM